MKIGNRARIPLLQKLAKFNIMRGEDEVNPWVFGDIPDVTVCCCDGFIWIGSRIKLVENTEMALRWVVHNTAQDFHTPARFGLEETVAARCVGDIQVAVKIVIGGDFGALIESVADLLGENNIE